MLLLCKLFFVVVLISYFAFFGTLFNSSKESPIEDEPELYGNFLHITDFHPDPHYVNNVTAKLKCHHQHFQSQGKPDYMLKGLSGPWGAPATICDSPLGLIDATFDWLEKNWKNKIDFIIWTGDNSRHDNDENIPRTPVEMFQLNRMITEKFLKTFANTNKIKNKRAPHFIPIVPSIGNNDIYPNKIIPAGPNDLLSILHDIWYPFIPEGQHRTFVDGGYYYTEVIPGKLIVVSLNTLYFFNANTAVNGCNIKGQPGTAQMKWLSNVLKDAHKRGMKVYLTGHVAPRAKQYTKSCYKKYGGLSLKYQDIILGHYYGHSNMDHFFFISSKGINKNYTEEDSEVLKIDDYLYDEEDEDDNDDVIENQEEEERMSLDIKKDDDKVEVKIKTIEKYMKKLLDHYRTLPPYTDDVAKDYVVVHINPSIIPTFFPALRIFKYNTTNVIGGGNTITKNDGISESGVTLHNTHKNAFLTPLGYTQYFINLTHANLYPNVTPEFTVEYTTWDDYGMEDLTVSSWIKLAGKIVNDGFKGGMLWKKIREHLLVGTRSLITQKTKSFEKCIYSECKVKGPEDYIATELTF